MVKPTKKQRDRDQKQDSDFLFVPVYGTGKSSEPKSTGSVSQQQHAARHYHRQVRLRRVRKAAETSKSGEKEEPKSEPRSWRNIDSFDPPPVRPQNQISPFSLLGAGRFNPFDTYCAEKPTPVMHEVLDHALSHQWSVFRHTRGLAGLNAIKADVMKSAMCVPVSWYTVLYAGASFYTFNYGPKLPPQLNEPLRLSFKDKALRRLRTEISESSTPSDELLLSMVILASHGTGEIPKLRSDKKTWTMSILSSSYNNDYFSGMETSWDHMDALKVLVTRRGGLSAIKLRTAITAIQLYDIFSAWRALRQPMFPLVRPTSYFMTLRLHKQDAAAMALSRILASDLLSIQVQDDHLRLLYLLQIVQHAATLVVDLDQWTRKTSAPPDLVHIEFTRWCVVHDLLSLPELSNETSKMSNDDEDDHDLVHDLIRFTTMAFLLFTLNSIREAGQLPLKLAGKIRTNLDTSVSHKTCFNKGPCVTRPGLFLWSVILGGMCAYAAEGPPPGEPPLGSHIDSPLLDAYLSYAEHLSLKAEPSAWPLVVNLTGRYLWMESECNKLGEVVWNYICEFHAMDTTQEQPFVPTFNLSLRHPTEYLY